MNDEVNRCVREAHSLHVELRKGMKRVFGKKLKERRQVPGRIDFNRGELPNPRVVAAEIFETAGETKGACDRRGQRHRSEIIFAIRAAKSLLQIDITDFLWRQLPLLD
jgi:hypothetical protein